MREYNKLLKWRIKVVIFSLLVLGIIYYVYMFVGQKDISQDFVPYAAVILTSNLLIVFSIWAIVKFLKCISKSKPFTPRTRKHLNKNFDDFIIGDERTYSLSRLQAVVWAIVILGYQLSQFFILLLKKGRTNNLVFFDLVFSEPVLWLLGLSLGTCITVKGITVDKLKSNPSIRKKYVNNIPKPIDIICNENGLDFSKCQMLLWTLAAIIVFNSKVYEFDKALYSKPNPDVKVLFQNYYEEYKSAKPYDAATPYVPYLSYTFIVLMGLAQGAYIGKKLVPDFKDSDVGEDAMGNLTTLTEQLIMKKEQYAILLTDGKKNTTTAADQQNIASLEAEIISLESQIAEVNTMIKDINQLTA